MRPSTIGLAVLALAAIAGGAAAQPTAGKPATPPAGYQVAAIRGYLYFHSTGTFSDKDLVGGGVSLWNTIIGEGDAGAPSSAVLVYVDVTGPDFATAGGKVVVEAKAGKQRLAKQSYTISDYFDEHGTKISLPLLVTGVGCDEVVVTATLTGKTKSSKKAVLPFACGE